MTPNASPMGQVILGFRSLLVKIALFVALLRMMVELRPPLNDLRCVENEEIESPSA